MMKFRWEKKYLYWGITAFLVIVSCVIFYLALNNLNQLYSAFSLVTSILMPFIVGLALAYLLNPIMIFFENRLLKPVFSKTKLKKPELWTRIIAIAITIILMLAVLTMLLFMVIPELADSIKAIISNSQMYLKNLQQWLLGILSSNSELEQMLSSEVENIGANLMDWAKTSLLPQMDSIISGVTSGIMGLLVFFKNFFIGLIISVYVLYSKEKFAAQCKKLLYALFPTKFGNRTLTVLRHSDKVFGGFVVGKLIDSLVIGILCFIGMSIFNMPYAMLISVIIGVTNVIPFFGPFIGAIPSALLILMIDPLTCLYFVIFILVLQQFDGNILGPLILGDSTGLSAFWVIFAILLSGDLFGFVGMIIGVPVFAVIYSLIVEFVNGRLKKHELPTDINLYKGLSSIDYMDNTMSYDDDDMTIAEEKPSGEKPPTNT